MYSSKIQFLLGFGPTTRHAPWNRPVGAFGEKRFGIDSFLTVSFSELIFARKNWGDSFCCKCRTLAPLEKSCNWKKSFLFHFCLYRWQWRRAWRNSRWWCAPTTNVRESNTRHQSARNPWSETRIFLSALRRAKLKNCQSRKDSSKACFSSLGKRTKSSAQRNLVSLLAFAKCVSQALEPDKSASVTSSRFHTAENKAQFLTKDVSTSQPSTHGRSHERHRYVVSGIDFDSDIFSLCKKQVGWLEICADFHHSQIHCCFPNKTKRPSFLWTVFSKNCTTRTLSPLSITSNNLLFVFLDLTSKFL